MTNQNTSAYLTKQVENRTTDFGRRIRTTAQTLHTIAEQLRGDVNTHAAADFADRGADIFDRIGSYLENSDLHRTACGATLEVNRSAPAYASRVTIHDNEPRRWIRRD